MGSLSQFPKQDDIQPVYAATMVAINQDIKVAAGEASPLLIDYIRDVYFPGVRNPAKLEKKRTAATIDSYEHTFKLIKPHLGNLTLASCTPGDVFSILQRTVTDHDAVEGNDPLSVSSTKHLKHFLGGVFTYARSQKHFNGPTPVHGVALPEAFSKETPEYAHTLEDILEMLLALQDHIRPLAGISLAAWSGLTRSEMQGLKWTDRYDGCLHVRRAVVNGVLGPTKTKARKAAVPIIPDLERVLAAYHTSIGKPKAGWMFPTSNPERPLQFNNLLVREVKPVFDAAGIAWHGWHAFRRGLGTNLRELGVPDDVCQRILRHANIKTTQDHYLMTRNPKVEAAMKTLSKALNQAKKVSKASSCRQTVDSRKLKSASR